MDEISRETWRLRFGTTEIMVKDLAQPVSGIITRVNGYINSALASNPYASLAWAGVTLLLPLSRDAVKWNDWGKLLDDIREAKQNFSDASETWRDIQYEEECSAAHQRHREAMLGWNSMGADVAGLRRAVESAQSETKRATLLAWLCDIDPSEGYNTARSMHKEGTGNWLIKDSEQFRAWEVEPSSFLWLHGKVGSGKTVLSSTVINSLRDRHSSDPRTALAYFYFSFSDARKQDVIGMLASIVKQLCARRPLLPQLVERFYEYQERGERPDTKTLEAALLAVLDGFSMVHIVIDALDECPRLNNERQRLLDTLGRICKTAPANLHLFCTSRKEADIDATLGLLLSPPHRTAIDLTRVESEHVQDIGLYIDSILASSDFGSWQNDLKNDARAVLIDRADGMFQYVAHQFDVLRKLSSENSIRKAIRELPVGLDATYDRLLQSIDPEVQPQVARSLMWLACSTESLTLKELAEIFILRLEGPRTVDRTAMLFKPEDVLKYFSGLVLDQSSSDLADAAVDALAAGSKSLRQMFSKHHLEGFADPLVPGKFSRRTSLFRMLRLPLCFTARRGFVTLTELLLSSHDYLVQEDLDAALADAAYGGSTAVVDLLLDSAMPANINAASDVFGDALRAAASAGHVETVQRLLDRGADIDAQRGGIGSALQAACAMGRVDVVRLLVDCGAEAKWSLNNSGSMLSSVTESGSSIVLRHLLESGICPEKNGGETPLHAAARNRLRSLADFHTLLERGADVNAPGGEYGYPLQALCSRFPAPAHTSDLRSAVELLLDKGAEINATGGKYGSALQCACYHHDTDNDDFNVVKVLLDRGADADARGGYYGTPFQSACTNPNFRSIGRLLVEKGADVHVQGGYYGNALQASCHRGILEAIEWLLDLGVDINASGGEYGSGRLPAILNKWETALQLVLDRGVDINDTRGRECATALQAALEAYWSESESQIRRDPLDVDRVSYRCPVEFLLLNCPNIEVNAEGGIFGSALQAAAYNGRTTAAKALLQHGANVDMRGGKYRSALNAAVFQGFWDIVEVLLAAGATPDSRHLAKPDEKWLELVREADGQGAVDRYRLFWDKHKRTEAPRRADWLLWLCVLMGAAVGVFLWYSL
ncbi:hypothetical protein NEMBOFW57_004298 [Staphylotrichum longicolle]|uniref:NACHT domain-containing protein n=1 Tax=Staphylotrichum longicolle TaxID=669026 RepID=A0AAD4I6K3_9PEZI|nr:hypothetical protein NEMBOFW57_004298 [Staphylotrichum longicolle]